MRRGAVHRLRDDARVLRDRDVGAVVVDPAVEMGRVGAVVTLVRHDEAGTRPRARGRRHCRAGLPATTPPRRCRHHRLRCCAGSDPRTAPPAGSRARTGSRCRRSRRARTGGAPARRATRADRCRGERSTSRPSDRRSARGAPVGRRRGRRSAAPTTCRRWRRPCCRRARNRGRPPAPARTRDRWRRPTSSSATRPTARRRARARATNAGKRRASSAWRVTKNTTTSRRPRACVRTCTPSGSFPSVWSNPSRCRHDRETRAFFDPELPRQRRARVAGRCHRRIVSPSISMIPSPSPSATGPQIDRAVATLSTGSTAARHRFSRPFHSPFRPRAGSVRDRTSSSSNFQEVPPWRSGWATKPRTSRPRPPRARSRSTTTSATAGGCCSRTRRTSRRCAPPSSARSRSARLNSTSAT